MKRKNHWHKCPTCSLPVLCSNVQPCPIPKDLECETCQSRDQTTPFGQCQFEIGPLYCGDCGAYIGEEGTCRDYATCKKCAILEDEYPTEEDLCSMVPASHDTITSPKGGYKASMITTRVNRTT